MVDYIPKYLTDEGFDFPRLLNDDFFVAIKLLFNNRCYVSSAKLLLSFVDTMASVEFGDAGSAHFRVWLNAYVDLKPVGVTAEEVWEHRNSLLHMTNLDSRKVLAGKVRRLLFYVGPLPSDAPRQDSEAKYYDLFALIRAVTNGIGPFANSVNENRAKFQTFIDRYDLIVSDHRVLKFDVLADPAGR